MSLRRSGAPCAPPVVLVLLASLSACGGGSATGWGGTVTDSAGVQLVSNPERGLWRGHPSWSFAEELRIGSSGMRAAGDSEAIFGQVVGIDVDSAGDVYVADQQARHVQVFGPDGHFLRTIGAPGNGPGEIGTSMTSVLVHGGQIWVPDLLNRRIDRFGLDGTSLGSDPVDLTKGAPASWAHSSGGRLITRMQTLPMPGMSESTNGDPLVAYADGSVDTLLTLPKGQQVRFTGGQVQFRLFNPEPLWAAGPDGRILTAVNTAYRVEERDGTGALVRIVTKPFTPRKITEGDQKKFLDAFRKMYAERGIPSQTVDQLTNIMKFADNYPAMQRLLAGPDSTLWVQGVRAASDLTNAAGETDFNHMGSGTWDVFDAQGRYLGPLALPSRFSPMLVRGEAVWGVQRDSLDVQSVVRYRVVEGS